MDGHKLDRKEKVLNLKKVQEKLVELGDVLSEIDPQHRKIVLEPKFQEKLSELYAEAQGFNLHRLERTLSKLKKQRGPNPREVHSSDGQPNLGTTSNLTSSDETYTKPAAPRLLVRQKRKKLLKKIPKQRDQGIQTQANSDPYQNKWKEQERRLTRIESHFNLLTRKISELRILTQKLSPTKPKSDTRLLYKNAYTNTDLEYTVDDDEAQLWQQRVEKTYEALMAQCCQDHIRKYNSQTVDQTVSNDAMFWKHRAYKLFYNLVRSKRADVRVWKSAEQFIDFDWGLQILTTQKHSKRRTKSRKHQ